MNFKGIIDITLNNNISDISFVITDNGLGFKNSHGKYKRYFKSIFYYKEKQVLV